jgi:hypothetical protein
MRKEGMSPVGPHRLFAATQRYVWSRRTNGLSVDVVGRSASETQTGPERGTENPGFLTVSEPAVNVRPLRVFERALARFRPAPLSVGTDA